MSNKYRKKPVVVDAEQWFRQGDVAGVWPYDDLRSDKFVCKHCGKGNEDHGLIETLEGWHTVCPGDWIITGVKGEKYPCKPDIFEATYEPADTPPTDCEVARLRAALEKTVNRLEWWVKKFGAEDVPGILISRISANEAIREAREALASTPKTPEPSGAERVRNMALLVDEDKPQYRMDAEGNLWRINTPERVGTEEWRHKYFGAEWPKAEGDGNDAN